MGVASLGDVDITLERMQVAYWVLSLSLFIPSSLLGMFFLATAGLAVSGAAMTCAWAVWLIGVALSGGGIGFAVQRARLGLMLGLCCAPVALALGAVQVALWFKQ